MRSPLCCGASGRVGSTWTRPREHGDIGLMWAGGAGLLYLWPVECCRPLVGAFCCWHFTWPCLLGRLRLPSTYFSTWYVRCLGSVGKHLNQMNYLVDTNVLKFFFFFSFTLSIAFSRVFTLYVFVTILLLLDPEAMCLTFSIQVFVLDVWDVCVSYPLFDTIHRV